MQPAPGKCAMSPNIDDTPARQSATTFRTSVYVSHLTSTAGILTDRELPNKEFTSIACIRSLVRRFISQGGATWYFITDGWRRTGVGSISQF